MNHYRDFENNELPIQYMALLDTESERIVLASNSPRRIELLKKVVTHFEVFASDINEDLANFLSPTEYAVELSKRKAEALCPKIDSGLIIGADSIVVIDKQILGKPKNKQQSYAMLELLSGKKHQVITGFTVIRTPEKIAVTDFESTEVKFRTLTPSEITKYITLNEPFDKAGSYGIQDDAAVFVESLTGCYYNVVGLPITKLYLVLKNMLNGAN